jgi:hypothetical protein
MSEIRSMPCSSCPYRRDVPSGVWAAHEYKKLVEYDNPTGEQPVASFFCHATPEALCHGWAVVHSNRGREYELLALRVWRSDAPLPEARVPLFESGTAAATHGLSDIADPDDEAVSTVERLLRKYPRLDQG